MQRERERRKTDGRGGETRKEKSKGGGCPIRSNWTVGNSLQSLFICMCVCVCVFMLVYIDTYQQKIYEGH